MAAILDTPVTEPAPLRVGLGTTMIEPALTGGHLDGIGVYTQALLRHLPQAGCAISTYSWPRGACTCPPTCST
jgi:alpha-1,3-rhamnosyl/mannosyltransferase